MEADSTQSTNFVIKAWVRRFYFEKKYLAINRVGFWVVGALLFIFKTVLHIALEKL